MKYRQILLVLLVLSIAMTGISSIFLAPENFGLCGKADDNCMYKYIDYEWLTAPLFLFSIVSFLLFLILIFLPESVFNAWIKFAIPWVFLSIALISIAPSSNGGGWINVFPLDKEIASWFTSGSFFSISLVLIFWKRYKIQNKV